MTPDVSGIAMLAQTGVEFAPERSLLLVAIAFGLLGLAVAAALATRATTPTTPPAASSTELTEPPALVDHLLGDGVVSTMALPATVVDLADRGHLQLDRPVTSATSVATTAAPGHDLLDYERDLVARLDTRTDLTVADLSWSQADGPAPLHRAFDTAVRREAHRRGLTTTRFPVAGGLVIVATLIAGGIAFGRALPDGGVDVQWNLPSLVALLILLADALVASAVLLPDVRQRTSAGDVVAAGWLAARSQPAAGPPRTPTLTPAHRAVLDLPPHPLGDPGVVADDPRRVWTITRHGHARPIRVAYPRWWPPGAGRPPLLVLTLGTLGLAAVAAVSLAIWRRGYGVDWIDFSDIGPTRAVAITVWTLLGVAGLAGVAVVVVGLIDLFTYRTSGGRVVRHATGVGPLISSGRWSARLGDLIPGLGRRRFLVIDDGHADATRALVVSERVQASCPPDRDVDLVASPILGHVRSARVLAPRANGRE